MPASEVTIIYGGPRKELNCEGITTLFWGDYSECMSKAKFFSWAKHTYSCNYYLFMDEHFDLIDNEALDKLVGAFDREDFQYAAGVYANVLVYKDEKPSYTKYFNSYDSRSAKSISTINAPFLVRKSIYPLFSEQIGHLHLCYAFNSLIRSYRLYQFPHTIFTENEIADSHNIQNDLEFISKTYA